MPPPPLPPINLKLNIKPGSVAAFQQAMQSIAKDAERSYRGIEKVNAALAPELVKYRVALTNAEKEAQLAYNEALEKQENIQGVLVQKAKTLEEKRRDALKSINQELESQQKRLARINALLEKPARLQKRVKAQLEVEGQEKKLAFAESKERARQLGPTKAIADLLNVGDLHKKLAGFGGKVAGVGQSVGGKAGGFLENLGGGLAGEAAGGLGGALAAAAGPIGIALVAAKALAPVVKGLASAPFKAVTAGMSAVNGALKELGGQLGPTGVLIGYFEGVGGMAKSLGDKLGPAGIGLQIYGETLEAVSKNVRAFFETAIGLAQKASPGTVQRFQLVLDDTAAVIGHKMIPVVELLGKVTRGVGDFLATMLPSTQEFRAALAPIGEAFDDVKKALAPVAVLLRAGLTVGLKMLGELLKSLANAVKFLTAPLRALVDELGINLNSSVGAAARGVSFSTAGAAAKQVYQAAANMGVDPAVRTAMNTSKTAELLQKILDKLGQTLKVAWENLPAGVRGVAGFAEGMVPGAGLVRQWLFEG